MPGPSSLQKLPLLQAKLGTGSCPCCDRARPCLLLCLSSITTPPASLEPLLVTLIPLSEFLLGKTLRSETPGEIVLSHISV